MGIYWVLGEEGQVYGPADAEQIRAWVDEGRITTATQLQADGSGEWRPLSVFPEFAGPLHTEGAPSQAADFPRPGPTDEEIRGRDYVVRFSEAIDRGWRVVMDNFWFFVGVMALLTVICLAATIPYVGFIAGLIVSPAVTAGFWWICIKRMRGQPADIGDLFAGFRGQMWLHLCLGSLVSSIFIGLGVVCCIVPGIYLSTALMFTAPLIIDRKMEFWPAMMLSLKMVHKHWWAVFGFSLLVGLIVMAGVFVCGVGILVSVPVASCAMALVYDDIFCALPVRQPARA